MFKIMINNSKYRAMEVQLFAMKFIEALKNVLYRVLQNWLSALNVVLQTCCMVGHDSTKCSFDIFEE